MTFGGSVRVLAAVVAVAAFGLTGCASEPPPVSAKVQKYYDENVANAKATLPPTKSAGPKTAFLGDSYTYGSGASALPMRWSSAVSRSLNLGEVNVGLSGTGYSNPGGKGGGTYAGRVAEVVAAKPAIVIVSGGRNDVVQKDPQVVTEAVFKTFADLRAGLPDAKIIALSPVWDAAKPPATLGVVAGDVRAAVTAVGGTYVDVGQPLANRPQFLAKDGIHPNDAGHRALADATISALVKSRAVEQPKH